MDSDSLFLKIYWASLLGRYIRDIKPDKTEGPI